MSGSEDLMASSSIFLIEPSCPKTRFECSKGWSRV
jgi:hypothetical protein